ncbi:MAG TPA: Ig-like domain-containing protein [Elusimicrobiota bacterium]|nr:Ig-like domain-containing protein [Elusimicrobiota bacterium]
MRFYQGDPASGGTLFHTSTITLPLTAGGSAVVATTWSASSAGSYDLYVQVDGGGLIDESDETNNKAFKTVSVVQLTPRLTQSTPTDGALGIFPTAPLVFQFNKSMSAATLTGAFSLRAVLDNEGSSVNELVTGTLAYDDSRKQAVFTPSAFLKDNHRYEATWSAAAQDALGFPMTPVSLSFQTAASAQSRNVVLASDRLTKVVFEPGAVASSYYVQVDVSPPANAAVESAANKTLQDKDAFSVPVSATLRRLVLYQGGAAVSPSFAADVRLTIPYADDGRGYVAGTNPPVKEENLSMYWLNETDGLWVRLPESVVDAVQNTVTSRVPHFSYFVLMGLGASDLSRAYAYPVPFRPNTGLGHARIKFTGLSPQCVIRIYGVSGEWVKTIEERDGDGFNDTWDASDVPSGTYLYIIDNGAERKTGQLVIVK